MRRVARVLRMHARVLHTVRSACVCEECAVLGMLIERLCRHVVFGKVVKGMPVVKAIEAVGSQSGETSKKV